MLSVKSYRFAGGVTALACLVYFCSTLVFSISSETFLGVFIGNIIFALPVVFLTFLLFKIPENKINLYSNIGLWAFFLSITASIIGAIIGYLINATEGSAVLFYLFFPSITGIVTFILLIVMVISFFRNGKSMV